MIKMWVVGDRKARRRLNRIKNRTPHIIINWEKWSLDRIEEEADNILKSENKKSNYYTAPWSKIESISNNWIRTDPFIEGSNISAILGNSSPHAHMVEFGTHTPITPVTASVMKFRTRDLGWVSKRSVRGQPPKRYLTRAINKNKDKLVRNLRYLIKSSYESQLM